MKFLILLFSFCASVSQLSALEIVAGKTVYHDCTQLRADRDELRFMHADGSARLRYDKLPDELRKKYFTPERLAELRENDRLVAAATAEADRAAEKAYRERNEMLNRKAAAADAELARKHHETAKEAVQKVERDEAARLAKLAPSKILNDKITTRDGQDFYSVTAKEATGNSLRITHAGGATIVAAARLPEEIQKAHFWPQQIEASARDAGIAPHTAPQTASEKAASEKAITADIAERKREKGAADAASQVAAEREYEAHRWASIRQMALAIIALLAGGMLYFLPTYLGRRKANIGAIFALNLVAGWTFVGWVVALVWALTKDFSPLERAA